MPARPDISIVISTYNRAEVLPHAIESLLAQDFGSERFEIVIVDNNSTDATREVVETFARKTSNLRYVFEPRQGASFGRNAGIAAARAATIAFTDDDIRVSASWLSTIDRALADHPDVACVGGRVLPNWAEPRPPWLTREHWGPLALVDYGDAPVYVTARRRLCLLTANVAYRRRVFDEIGMFSPRVQTMKRVVATEDHELLLRLWRAGGQGLYWPGLVATSDVAPERMLRAYHRRWHYRHGRSVATMHDEMMEQTQRGRLVGVPCHVYAAAARSVVGWLRSILSGRREAAFVRELEFWSAVGFIQARWLEVASRGGPRSDP
jgi:glycosyltransferase involved in cell wall biosynthesis